MRIGNVLVAVCLSAIQVSALAKGASHAGAQAPGVGSKPVSTHVNGYVKKDGTYVEPHQRSTADKQFENNWTTKGNDNPVTGKDGSRVTEPATK